MLSSRFDRAGMCPLLFERWRDLNRASHGQNELNRQESKKNGPVNKNNLKSEKGPVQKFAKAVRCNIYKGVNSYQNLIRYDMIFNIYSVHKS